MMTLSFGDLTLETFLAEYWQKKPLLIRGALPGFVSPLSPEDLAALACEEEASSRLVLEDGGAYPWQLFYGPFEPEDFADLPETHWSLLVQEVDQWVPEVAALLEPFRFIPNWRIDDVMVSYAPKDGGVGAHIDNYDVFLLQGLGHRRWQINHTPVAEENLLPDLDVRILADFEADADWVLAPGDLLYLPPRIAHYGVALDDCMTYSIGFRAPSDADLVEGFLSAALEQIDPAARYGDPDLKPTAEPGKIDEDVLIRMRHFMRSLVADDTALDTWFGSFITQPKRGYTEPLDEPYTEDELREAFGSGATLRRGAVYSLAYHVSADGETMLFAGGHAIPLAESVAFAAPLLSGKDALTAKTLAPHLENADFVRLVTDLVNEGVLRVDEG